MTPRILPDRAAMLDAVTFAQGAHNADSGAMCVMECVAYVAGEPWSDHPACVSPVIAAFCRSWNDALPEPPRTQLLRPLVPVMIGTRTTEADEQTRVWMVTDWLVRVQTPAWLRLAGLTAEGLRALDADAHDRLTRLLTTILRGEHPEHTATQIIREFGTPAPTAAALTPDELSWLESMGFMRYRNSQNLEAWAFGILHVNGTTTLNVEVFGPSTLVEAVRAARPKIAPAPEGA